MDPQLEAQSFTVDPTSQVFLGRWNGLVSTTNWEKGRIIVEWRNALIEAGAAVTEYSDDAWSRYVGNVSSQHVGRLRRVFEQFGQQREEYPGLYWSHFAAALDWHDAEMWLEGAVQNGWSISQMRKQRWEATGGAAEEEPHPGDIVTAEWDEDTLPAEEAISQVRDVEDAPSESDTTAELDPGFEGEDEADDDLPPGEPQLGVPFESAAEEDVAAATPPVRPFADLPSLPDDLAEAMESLKLALLRHKVDGWQHVSRDDALAWLRAMEQLLLAQ